MGKKKEIEYTCDCEDDGLPSVYGSPYGLPSPIISVKNHIYFYTEIDATTTRALFSVLHETAMDIINNSIENNCPIVPIILHINSNGGEISNTFGIIRCIKDIQEGKIHQVGGIPIKVPVETWIDAECDSGASLIACVGSKRYITKDSLCLLHDVRTTYMQGGKTEDIHIESENLGMYKERMHKIYVEHSNGKLTEEKIAEICSNEKYSTPEELLAIGLVDEIVD